MVRQDPNITHAVEDGMDELLDRVDRGEQFTLTRAGRAVADVTPKAGDGNTPADDPGSDPDYWTKRGMVTPGTPEAEALLERMEALRRQIIARQRADGVPPITTEEIVAWIREDRD